MANNNLTQTKWADHVRGCADLAKEIATRLDIRDDPARQACFATIMIDAGKHNIFLEPIPEAEPMREAGTWTIDPPQQGPPKVVVDPPAVSMWAIPATGTDGAPQRKEPPKGEVVGENVGAIRDPTPEQAEAASRGALLKGINSARELLGFTPKKLNEYIQEKLKTHKTLGVLDVDELADLTERLSKRIDAEKKNERLAATNDPLEDWP